MESDNEISIFFVTLLVQDFTTGRQTVERVIGVRFLREKVG